MTTKEQQSALQARIAELESDAKSLADGIASMQKNIAANNGALQYNATLIERVRKQLVEIDAAEVAALQAAHASTA